MTGANRRRLTRIHTVAGLIFSVPLLVIAVSGILLGFYDTLRYASFPYRMEHEVTQPLPPAALADAARAALPGQLLESLYLPTAPDRAARGRLKGEGGKPSVVFLDPSTGRVLEVRDASRKDWIELLHDLHRGRIAGAAGEWLAAAAALALFFVWASGLPLKRTGHASGNVHGRLGKGVGGILCFIALTGGLLSFAKPLRENFYPSPRLSVAAGDEAVELARLVAAGTSASGGAALERVIFPTGTHPLTLRFHGGGRAYLDHLSGAILGVETSVTPWLNLLYPLHSGRLLGSAGPPLMAALSLLLVCLTVTGVRLYRRRSEDRLGLMRTREILSRTTPDKKPVLLKKRP